MACWDMKVLSVQSAIGILRRENKMCHRIKPYPNKTLAEGKVIKSDIKRLLRKKIRARL